MKHPFPFAAALLAAAFALFTAGCATPARDDHGGHDHNHGFEDVKQLAAVIQPTPGNKCAGFARFIEVGHVVYVYAEISGLTPNEKHAIHLSEFGDGTAADASRAGGLFGAEESPRRLGELGNLQADATGKAVFRAEFKDLSTVGVGAPIIGRGVIVRARALEGGLPVGNAGARIGFGVIGVGNPKQ